MARRIVRGNINKFDSAKQCPKCHERKYVGRSLTPGFRLCRKCSIKWNMKYPDRHFKVEIVNRPVKRQPKLFII